MPYLHEFIAASISGDTEINLQGSHDVRITSATSTPRLIGLNGGIDGIELAIHNLSGASVPIIHGSVAASAPFRKILTTGLGGNFTLPDGQIVWAILVDPNDAAFPDGARGWYLDSGGQEVLARTRTTAATSAPTHSSSTPAGIPEMTLSISTVGGDLLVGFSAAFDVHDGDVGTVQLYVDGVAVADTLRAVSHTGGQGALGVVYSIATLLVAFDAGAHTIEAQWAATAGTMRAVGTQRLMYAMEVP